MSHLATSCRVKFPIQKCAVMQLLAAMCVGLVTTCVGYAADPPQSQISSENFAHLPQALATVLNQTRPLTVPRGSRLPLYVLPISHALSQTNNEQSEIALRELDRRGIAYSVDWQNGNRVPSLQEGLRIADIQTRLRLPININATSCLYPFYNGAPDTAHLDDQGNPFFDLSFDPNVKIGCPFAVEHRIPAIREQVEFFLQAYHSRKLKIDFIFADWEVDGPLEWNGAWEAAHRCRRCRECIQKLNDFHEFQKSVRLIRANLQREAFVEPVLKRFPQAKVGNYGVYPDDGYRYWYDYFEQEPGKAIPVKRDQRAPYRPWYPEFGPSGYSCAIPVVYTWYPIFQWYDFQEPDYRWFYNLLKVGSTVTAQQPQKVPVISFVHWNTTAPPKNPDPRVLQFSPQAYQELLRHLLLRGHDTLFLWCMSAELGEEMRLLHEVYAESLQYAEFLQRGTPISFAVPSQPGPIVSGVVLDNRVLVRRTEFGQQSGAISIPFRGRDLQIPSAPGKWQILPVQEQP